MHYSQTVGAIRHSGLLFVQKKYEGYRYRIRVGEVSSHQYMYSKVRYLIFLLVA